MTTGAAMFELPAADLHALRLAAYKADLADLGIRVVMRIRDGSLSPDDTKGWTRALVYLARKVDPTLGRP